MESDIFDMLKETVHRHLARLPDDRHRYILTKRFGLDDGRSQSVEELAEYLHMTPDEVAEAERKCLAILQEEQVLEPTPGAREALLESLGITGEEPDFLAQVRRGQGSTQGQLTPDQEELARRIFGEKKDDE